jgi:neutral ceramidase
MRILFVLMISAMAVIAADVRAGTAAVKITPPKGAPMAGYYYNRAADGVHDDLFAKALVLESEGVRVALVACDVESLPRAIVEQARKKIEADTGIGGAAVMISATHSHTGPVILEERSPDKLEGEMLNIARKYAEDLPEKIAESVKLAAAALKPVGVSAAIGREPSLTFNRRFYMKDGSVGWNPGKLNPAVVRPAGPTDPAVPVVYFEALDGHPLATYVNYAMHLDTVGGFEYSADYAYTLSKLLAAAKSADMLTLFTIGCAGNLNHIDVNTAAKQSGHKEAARIGTVLAAEVLRTLKKMERLDLGAPRMRSEIVRLPLPEIRPGELEWTRKITPMFGKEDGAPFMDLVRAFKIVEVAERAGRPLEAEVQVITLGDRLAWVGLPGEIFTELGMMIKLGSPFQYTIVASLANGSIGYVPDRKAYPQGAYEPVSARCAAGSGELLVDASTRLLVEIHEHSR